MLLNTQDCHTLSCYTTMSNIINFIYLETLLSWNSTIIGVNKCWKKMVRDNEWILLCVCLWKWQAYISSGNFTMVLMLSHFQHIFWHVLMFLSVLHNTKWANNEHTVQGCDKNNLCEKFLFLSYSVFPPTKRWNMYNKIETTFSRRQT